MSWGETESRTHRKITHLTTNLKMRMDVPILLLVFLQRIKSKEKIWSDNFLHSTFEITLLVSPQNIYFERKCIGETLRVELTRDNSPNHKLKNKN